MQSMLPFVRSEVVYAHAISSEIWNNGRLWKGNWMAGEREQEGRLLSGAFYTLYIYLKARRKGRASEWSCCSQRLRTNVKEGEACL